MLNFWKISSKDIPSFYLFLNLFRDVDHPNEDMGKLYAQDVKDICDKLAANGKKPSCFIAESLQSCGGK